MAYISKPTKSIIRTANIIVASKSNNNFFNKKEDEIESLRQNMKRNGPTTNSNLKQSRLNNDSFESSNPRKNQFNFSFSNKSINTTSDKSFLKQKELANNKLNSNNSNFSNNNINNSNINLSNKIQHLYQNIINCEININPDNSKQNESQSFQTKLNKFSNLISPSNLKTKAEKVREDEDSYGISKDLLKTIIHSKRPIVKRAENNRLVQKMGENKKLLDYFFTKRNYSCLNDNKSENVFEKNSFNDFYSKISTNYSLKDLNYKKY